MDKVEYFYRETNKHIRNVQLLIYDAVEMLLTRAHRHDISKFDDEEKSLFVEFTPELGKIQYGSEEYKAILEKLKPAVEHHNMLNPHHPENHVCYWECNGCFRRYRQEELPGRCERCGYSQFTKMTSVDGMSLIDLIEMICDWIASSKRNPGGDIIKSIEINQKRFGYTDELRNILFNTAEDIIGQGSELEPGERFVE